MIKINLLPEKDYGLQERFFDDLVFLVLGLLLCGIVLFFLGRGLDGQISALDRTIEKKNQIIADHEIIIKKVKEVEESRKTLEQQLNTINQLKEDKIGPVRMLEEFALLVPDQVWIEKFYEQGLSLELDARSYDEAQIALFLDNLKKSKHFENMSLGVVESREFRGGCDPVKEKNLSFRVTGNVRYR